MLTIAKLAGGSEGYYLSTVASGVEDYYTGRGEAPGYWASTAAHHAGLTGEVHGEHLRTVLGGALPGGGKLPGLRASRRVPGFDATVAAPKSVSLLYALADPSVSEQVRQAHDTAVAAALGYLEEQAAFVRRGAQGVEQVQAEGLLAAAFRHRTSRNLDPHLHTHVLIANQGQAVDDGRWRTLDARHLYEAQTTAGYLYQAVLRWEVTSRLGVAWGPVVNGHADLAGVPRVLIEAFSTRTRDLKQHLAILRGEAGDGEIRQDWTAKEAELAAYKTRQAKQRLADGAPLRQRWREKAEALGWRPDQFERLLGQTRAVPPSPEQLEQVAAELAGPDGLTAQQSTFNLGDVVRAWAARLPNGAPAETIVALARQTLADRDVAVRLLNPDLDGEDDARAGDLAVVNRVLRRLADATEPKVLESTALSSAVTRLLAAGLDPDGLTARLTARELVSADDPAAVLTWRACQVAAEVDLPVDQPPVSGQVDWLVIRRDDGGVVVSKGQPRYSTPELLATETAALATALSRRPRRVAVADPKSVARALTRRGWLAAEQRTLVRRVTTDPGGVQVVVGQAGAGKTAALAAAAEAFDSAGITVRGCAIAARAALQLQQDSGIPSTTITALLRDLDTGHPLEPGSVLVVDEAAMADTRTLARLLHATSQAGAKLVLVGDPAQLPEIGAGGLFAGLLYRLDPITLTENRRQRHDWDRDVLARLRTGDPAPLLAAYQTHNRLAVADTDLLARDQMAVDWAAWARQQPDRRLGDGTMLAGRRDHVDALNRTARTLLRAAGRLGPDILIAAGRAYAVGDRVVCLRNDKRLRVTNGTRGQVTAIDPGTGAVTLQVDGPEPATVLLPAQYVRGGHLDHGYALTVHKAQGATVDRAWVYADTRTVSAEWLYTALSRHRDTAHLYTSHTTLEDLAVDLEAHAPQPNGLGPGETTAIASLRAKAARSRAKALATNHAPASPGWRGPSDQAAIGAPAATTPSVPRPPAHEWPQPIGLDL